MNNQVFTYWAGPMPPWIELCLESLSKNCLNIKILDDSFWKNEYDGAVPIKPFFKQPIHFRSNVLRTFLLVRYGGIWVDADCIALRDLSDIGNLLEFHDFVTYSQSRGGICSALVAAKKGSKIAWSWWKLTKHTSLRNIRKNKWNRLSLGPRLLRKALNLSGDCGYCVLPSNHVHPIHWHNHKAFQSNVQPIIDNKAWCWMLTSGSLGEITKWSRNQIIESETLIGRVFRHALGIQ